MDQPKYGQPSTGQPYGAPPTYPPPPGYGQPAGYSQPPDGQQPFGQLPYGQQPYAGAYAPLPQASADRWGPTSLGMDANVAAGLSYVFIVGVIFFFVEKTNRFVRFHSAQATLLSIGVVALSIAWMVLSTIVAIATSSSYGASAVLGRVFFLGYVGIFGLWLWGLIAGFSGKYTKLPIIGDIAESWAGGPATPAL
jgi:uncharacterized membrane protein